MAINFHPKAGMVLMCDFRGNILPEIGKTRPVVVVTPAHVRRRELATVIPLSTKAPHIPLSYHHRLTSVPFPGAAQDVWAKCDLVQSVSHERLDRIRTNTNNFVVGYVSHSDLIAICYSINAYFGIDPAPFRA
jgi:mRNA interferase MazF